MCSIRFFAEKSTFNVSGTAKKILYQAVDIAAAAELKLDNYPFSISDSRLVKTLAEVLKEVIDYKAYQRKSKIEKFRIRQHIAMRLEVEAKQYKTCYKIYFTEFDTIERDEDHVGNGICWDKIDIYNAAWRYGNACFPADLFMNKTELKKTVREVIATQFNDLLIEHARAKLLFSKCGAGKVHQLFDNKSLDMLISDYAGSLDDSRVLKSLFGKIT